MATKCKHKITPKINFEIGVKRGHGFVKDGAAFKSKVLLNLLRQLRQQYFCSCHHFPDQRVNTTTVDSERDF